jgi:short-subunit dehydrogenase involved in D-alanine esterification of teichoic acids
MGRLTDKNILITGGNSGIGLATAQEFDREGARVAICGLNERTLQAAKRRWEPEVSPFARTSANSPTSIRCSPRSSGSSGTWTAFS